MDTNVDLKSEAVELLSSKGSVTPISPITASELDPTETTAADTAIEHLKDVSSEKDRLDNIAQASWFSEDWGVGEKWKGFSNTWEDTWLAKGVDYFKYDRAFIRGIYQDDPKFKEDWTDDAVFDFLKQRNLGLEDFNDIKEAVNMEHAIDLADMITIKKERETQIRNSLSDGNRLAYSLITGFADVDIIIGGAAVKAAKTYAKTNKMNNIIATTAGMGELGYGAFVSAIDDDTSLAEAMVVGLAIGAIDYSVVRSFSKEDMNKIVASTADAPNDNAIKEMADRQTSIINASNMSANPKMKELIDELYVTNPNQTKVKTLMNEIGDFDELIKNTDDIAEVNRLKILTDEVRRRMNVSETPHMKELDAHIKTQAKNISELEKRIAKLEKDGVALTDPKMKKANKQLVKARKKESIALGNQNKILNQVKKDIYEIASDVAINITRIKNDLKELAGSEVDIATEMMDVYKAMHRDGHITKSEFEQLQYAFNKGKGVGKDYAKVRPKIELKSNGVNKGVDVVINGKKIKKLPYAVGAGLIATTGASFGYDGGDLAVDAPLILTAAVLGITGIANARTIAKHIASSGTTLKMAGARAKTVGARVKIGETLDKTRTSLTETIKPLLENTTGEVQQLVKDIFYNPLETQKTVERIKNRIFHSHWLNLQKDTHQTYVAWLKESGISRLEGALSLFRASSKRSEYNKLVSQNIEYGMHSDIRAVVDGAKKVNETLDSMLKEMKESGVKDIDKALLLKNYLPRVTNKPRVQALLANATAASKEAFIQEFAKMLTKTGDPQAVARVYVEALADPLLGSGRKSMSSIKDIEAVANKHGFGEDVVNEIAEALGVAGDRFGRLKNRIPMNKTMFKGVTIEYLDGTQSYAMTIDDIFEHDVMNVMADYLNKASGQVAFADMGYKSVDEAYEILHKANIKPEHARTIEDGIAALTGSPLVDYSIKANRIMRDVSNYTMGIKMMFSTLSLAAEALTTAGRLNKSGWRGVLQGVTNKLRGTYGDDSFIMGYLTSRDGMGLGMHQYGASFGAYRQIDEFGNIAGGEAGLSILSKVGEIHRDITLHVLPFVRTSDFLTKVNMQDSLQVLFNHAQGIKKFKDYELKAYAITPRMEELMKRLEVNEKGHVKWFDMDKWGRADKIEFQTTLDAMLQKRIQQSTMGTTGAWSRNSAIGVVASNLIKFPMSAYSNIGSFLGRGVLDGDINAMIQTTLWFGGGVIASIARKEIKGQDYDEEDIILDAILSHPFAGGYGTLTGLMNPAPVKALSDVQGAINIYNYK